MQNRGSSKKIAVLNAKALGDFIVTLPAIEAIKKHYPSSKIIYLGRRWHKDFLSERKTDIDEVIVLPEIEGVTPSSSPADTKRINFGKNQKLTMSKFIKNMQAEKFDIVLQMQGSGEYTNPFLKQFRAKFSAGCAGPTVPKLDASIPYTYYQSEVIRNLEIAGLIGAVPETIEPRLTPTPIDMQKAYAFLKSIHVKKNYIILHPGADDIRRRWPAEKFARCASILSKSGYIIILTGTKKERDLTASILKLNKDKAEVIDTAGKLSLSELIGLVSIAKLVISNDTGPLHLARALGKKTIGIYWIGNLLNWGPLTRKLHRVAISFETHCPSCTVIPAFPHPFEPKNECSHLFSFVEGISVEEVIFLTKQLL